MLCKAISSLLFYCTCPSCKLIYAKLLIAGYEYPKFIWPDCLKKNGRKYT